MKVPLLLAFFILLPLTSIFAVHECTIITKSGVSYEHAKCYFDNTYEIVTILQDDGNQYIAHRDIAVIYDTDGKDITESIIKQSGIIPQDKDSTNPNALQMVTSGLTIVEPEASGKDSDSINMMKDSVTAIKPVKTKKLNWRIGFGTGGNFSMPVGSYYNDFRSGIGFDFDFMLRVSNKVAVIMSVSKSGIKTNIESTDLYSNYNLIQDNSKLSAMRYSLSIMSLRPFKKQESAGSYYYISAGLGFITHKFSGDIIVQYRYEPYNLITDSMDNIDTRVLANMGVGMVLKFSEKFGIDLAVKWDVVFLAGKRLQRDWWSNKPFYEFDIPVVFNTQAAGILDIKLRLISFL